MSRNDSLSLEVQVLRVIKDGELWYYGGHENRYSNEMSFVPGVSLQDITSTVEKLVQAGYARIIKQGDTPDGEGTSFPFIAYRITDAGREWLKLLEAQIEGDQTDEPQSGGPSVRIS